MALSARAAIHALRKTQLLPVTIFHRFFSFHDLHLAILRRLPNFMKTTRSKGTGKYRRRLQHKGDPIPPAPTGKGNAMAAPTEVLQCFLGLPIELFAEVSFVDVLV